MKKRVFISRSLPEDHPFRSRSSEIEWVDQPMIRIEPRPFDTVVFDSCTWLFFTSSNAVKNYLDQLGSVPKQRIAAVGPGTAATLKELGLSVAYIGQRDTEHTATDFANKVGRSMVGFPVGDQSLRTIQQGLPSEQVAEEIVYSTKEVPQEISTCDAYYFTSPSNVRSFFTLNTLPSDAKVIAIGEPTALELRKHGVVAQKPENYEVDAQWEAIFSALSS